jgi:hypothetical protein
MRYLRQRLERIRTSALVLFVAFADLALFFGIVPFELYLRSVLLQHRSDVPFLLSVLGANALLVVFLLTAMAAASVLLARGARRAVQAAVPVLRRRPK